MWSMSGAARQLLAQSHTMNAKIEVLHGGKPVYTLVPYSGTVNAAAGRSVMRNLGCTVTDPTGRLGGGDVDDLLSPYDCEVKPYRGVLTPAGWEWVPQGVFGLTARNVVGDGQVQLTGQDRAMVYQGGMPGQVAFNFGTPVEQAIQTLLNTRQPGLQLKSWNTGYAVGPLLYKADVDVWNEAQKLAQSVGGWLWHDREGYLNFGPLSPRTFTISGRYEDGDGILLKANRKEDSDTIHNVVVVQNSSQQTATGGALIISAMAADTDPTSPTYYKGRYGTRTHVITNQTVTSQQQAQQAAALTLVTELGRVETATISVSPHPGLDPLDLVTVDRPSVGLVERTLAIQEVDLPLIARDPMAIQFRKYILTEDGQTVMTQLSTTS
jgi:hypothetical protein